MSDRGPSRTAAYVALFRALETRLPDDKRLFSDPFADAFLDARLTAALMAAKVPVTGRAVPEVIDRGWPSVRVSVIVRTRFIDEALIDAIEDGIEQVVLLGAGFDARPYRLEATKRTRVFEVDEAATQERKREAIEKRLGTVPQHVTFVRVDFERDDLVSALSEAGLDPTARAVFIWEGVMIYLTAEAVDGTLRAIRQLGAPGSRLIFTNVDRAVLEAGTKLPGAREAMDRVRRAGEPFVFGLDPEEVPGYLAERGFELVEQASSPELARRYLHPLGRRPWVSRFSNVVLATY